MSLAFGPTVPGTDLFGVVLMKTFPPKSLIVPWYKEKYEIGTAKEISDVLFFHCHDDTVLRVCHRTIIN
jgi:hypothetical protein